MSTSEVVIGEYLGAHTAKVEAGVKRRKDWDGSLEKRETDGNDAREIGIKVFCLEVKITWNTHYIIDGEEC
jgi:hypothetical protein